MIRTASSNHLKLKVVILYFGTHGMPPVQTYNLVGTNNCLNFIIEHVWKIVFEYFTSSDQDEQCVGSKPYLEAPCFWLVCPVPVNVISQNGISI